MRSQQDNKEERRPATEEADRRALADNGTADRQTITDAHQAAEQDMEDDAEFTASSPNDDLDEGETARLGENTDLV